MGNGATILPAEPSPSAVRRREQAPTPKAATSTISCDYCLGPIVGRGLSGRAMGNGTDAKYCCFGCLSLGEQRQGTATVGKQFSGLAFRIGFSIVIIAQSMILSLGITLEESTSAETKYLVYGGVLLGTLVTVALLGIPLVRSAWNELKQGFITLESLFLLTMGGAFIASMQSLITASGPVYFEVVSVILVVYSLGKAIMARAKQQAIRVTDSWADSLAMCRRWTNHQVQIVPVKEIVPGDIVEVLPGANIPIDGIVESGTGFVSVTAMTGEPYALVKRPGQSVLAGSISQEAMFRILSTRSGTDRQVDHLLRIVADARNIPSTNQAIVDRISARVFPLLILIAVGTFAYWSWQADWSRALFYSMSVLLVACPCALGLATPLVIWSTLARLAERGLVVRSGNVVERLAQVDTVVFDKTGTLTEDRLVLVDLVWQDSPNQADWLRWLLAIQSRSTHPIAKAFTDWNPQASEVSLSEVRVIPGGGIEAIVEEHGHHHVRIGRAEWMEASPAVFSKLDRELKQSEGLRVCIEIDGQLVGLAILQERLRESVTTTIDQLKQLGLSLSVLTGDTLERAKAIGLDNVSANQLPMDKTAHLQALKDQGRKVLMVGDGINDAGALSTAHVGMSLATGTDNAVQSADVTLYHDDLRAIPWAIALTQQAQEVIRRNLIVAGAYNMVGITLAAMGQLHPVVAALLMVGSSIYVAWSASRIGISAIDACHEPKKTITVPTSLVWCHGLSFVLQGIMLISLLGWLDGRGLLLSLTFSLIGIWSAYRWGTTNKISHQADMIYGMMSLGNLGMIFGWWADAGFRPLTHGQCDCVQSLADGIIRPWMWLGMWLGGTVSMAKLGRTPVNGTIHRWSMYTGGNLGMALGMALGSWAISMLPSTTTAFQAIMNLAGMTIGMIVGMLAGTGLTEQSILRWKRISRKLRANQ